MDKRFIFSACFTGRKLCLTCCFLKLLIYDIVWHFTKVLMCDIRSSLDKHLYIYIYILMFDKLAAFDKCVLHIN